MKKYEQIKAKYREKAFPIIDEWTFDEAVKELLDESAALKAAIARMFELLKRKNRALWKLKAIYFYRLFQWSMEGKRLAPEDDEPENFFMECIGKHTKRKSEWGKDADMFDDARIVCIKKAEEYK